MLLIRCWRVRWPKKGEFSYYKDANEVHTCFTFFLSILRCYLAYFFYLMLLGIPVVYPLKLHRKMHLISIISSWLVLGSSQRPQNDSKNPATYFIGCSGCSLLICFLFFWLLIGKLNEASSPLLKVLLCHYVSFLFKNSTIRRHILIRYVHVFRFSVYPTIQYFWTGYAIF